MNRRTLLSLTTQAGLLSVAPKPLRTPHLATPSPEQLAWQDLELGMFVHFGPETWRNGRPDTFTVPASEMNPAQLDTNQWARTAVALGAKYIVFVAKHQEGFCWWQTETTPYSVAQTPWQQSRGDVLADLVASCRKFGLKLGVYVSPRDDHFGAATGGLCKTPAEQLRYNAIYRQQLTEVFTRYGPLVEVWFDGSTATPVADLLRRYQPHAVIFQGPQATIRWVGNEDGFAPYPCWNGINPRDAGSGTSTALDSNPDGLTWLPSEVDVSIRRPAWFWKPNSDATVLTLPQLLSIYYRSVGRGAQLLLNLPANTDGLLPNTDVVAARALGDEIARRFGKPIALTRGSGTALTLTLPNLTRVDTVILQEEIAHGERVRIYRLEALMDNGLWVPIARGTAIGHKRIQPIKPVTSQALRLIILESAATPMIRTFAAFNTGTAPPDGWSAPVMLWAPDLVGEWHNNHFTLDLTPHIQTAAQYRLRFVPSEGIVVSVAELMLTLHGTPASRYLKHDPSHPDELLLDITGKGEPSASLTGAVQGAATGQILLQKL